MKNIISYLVAVFVLATSVCPAHAGTMQSQPQHAGHGPLFNALDSNGDGIVSKAEFDAFNDRQFKALDSNGDGKISPEELQSAQIRAAQAASLSHGNGTTHLDQRFYAADANHDGGLDRQEAKNMPMLSKYFDEVDANKDGKVTRKEYFDAMPLLHGVKKMDITGKAQSM